MSVLEKLSPQKAPAYTRVDFKLLKMPSRLESMALAQRMVAVPEGTDALEKGTQVCVQLLHA
jgi:hypothetical protein